MKILAIMTVKNEADIIEASVSAAQQWADYIAILDNQSSDNTVTLVHGLASRFENVLFWGRYEGPFHDWLRSLVFNDYKHLVNEGDWVCRLDADEFYIDNPKEFLPKLKENVDLVYSASFQYYFTEKDVELEKGGLSAHKRMRYYLCNHSEERFFKIKSNTVWPISRGWPFGLSKISTERIRLKHFQYRSEAQMKSRFLTRNAVNHSVANTNLFMHEHNNNKVFDSSKLILDSGVFDFDDHLLPALPKIGIGKRIIYCIMLKILNLSLFKNAIYPATNTRVK